jgi:hypothetical protein
MAVRWRASTWIGSPWPCVLTYFSSQYHSIAVHEAFLHSHPGQDYSADPDRGEDRIAHLERSLQSVPPHACLCQNGSVVSSHAICFISFRTVLSLSDMLHIEVFDKTLLGSSSLGYVNVPLSELEDQLAVDKWYPLQVHPRRAFLHELPPQPTGR